MNLTPSVVERRAREYREHQPLFAVEQEHVEMLPETFADGEFGWRDAEWVVQWYFRRHLGGFPDAKRRAAEEAYGENSFEDVLAAIETAVEGEDAAEKLAGLTDLEGVDVPLASAFLQYVDPGAYVVVGEREWEVLHDAGELPDAYPDPPSVADYQRYLAACRRVADRVDCDLWTLYRAIWRLGMDE